MLDKSAKVLVCAASNTAIDLLTERVVEKGLFGPNGKGTAFPQMIKLGGISGDDHYLLRSD
jgi:hypothetical protein